MTRTVKTNMSEMWRLWPVAGPHNLGQPPCPLRSLWATRVCKQTDALSETTRPAPYTLSRRLADSAAGKRQLWTLPNCHLLFYQTDTKVSQEADGPEIKYPLSFLSSSTSTPAVIKQREKRCDRGQLHTLSDIFLFHHLLAKKKTDIICNRFPFSQIYLYSDLLSSLSNACRISDERHREFQMWMILFMLVDCMLLQMPFLIIVGKRKWFMFGNLNVVQEGTFRRSHTISFWVILAYLKQCWWTCTVPVKLTYEESH